MNITTEWIIYQSRNCYLLLLIVRALNRWIIDWSPYLFIILIYFTFVPCYLCLLSCFYATIVQESLKYKSIKISVFRKQTDTISHILMNSSTVFDSKIYSSRTGFHTGICSNLFKYFCQRVLCPFSLRVSHNVYRLFILSSHSFTVFLYTNSGSELCDSVLVRIHRYLGITNVL